MISLQQQSLTGYLALSKCSRNICEVKNKGRWGEGRMKKREWEERGKRWVSVLKGGWSDTVKKRRACGRRLVLRKKGSGWKRRSRQWVPSCTGRGKFHLGKFCGRMSGSRCAGGRGLAAAVPSVLGWEVLWVQGARPLPWTRRDCEPRPVVGAEPSGAEDSGLWTQADLIHFQSLLPRIQS